MIELPSVRQFARDSSPKRNMLARQRLPKADSGERPPVHGPPIARTGALVSTRCWSPTTRTSLKNYALVIRWQHLFCDDPMCEMTCNRIAQYPEPHPQGAVR